MNAGRYDRQQGIPGWNQSALREARVLVAGAGALGNELIKNLVLMGIGHLMVVDFDRVEVSNLSRAVLLWDADVGRSKAQAVTEAAAKLNHEVDARFFDGDLLYDIGLGFYRHADLVVGTLDNQEARSLVGAAASMAGLPYLDGAMWALGGEVRWFDPGSTCFNCTLSELDRLSLSERRSCSGFARVDTPPGEQPVSTTVSTSSVIGGLLAKEVVQNLCGQETHFGEVTVYNGLKLSLHVSALKRDPTCPYHEPLQNIVELEVGANDLRADELLRRAKKDLGSSAVLELGRNFLLGFFCTNCGGHEEINKLLGRVSEHAALCPECGTVRSAEITTRIEGGEPYAGRRLSELGVPPGEVLTAHEGEELRAYELTRDVVQYWN
jgi:molybdopterin/thiamine biosynthesis adenylyltransferase